MSKTNSSRVVCLWASAALFCIGAAGPALSAQSNDENACRLIQDNMQRLACFDRLFEEQSKQQLNENAPDVLTERAQSVINNAQSSADSDDIDRRAQALMNKSRSTQDPFASSTPRVSSNTNRQTNTSSSDSSFGSEALQADTSDEITEIQSTVSAINEDNRGRANLSLSNGQVWRHSDHTHLTIREGDVVTIEKGVLGAYYLSEINSNRTIRVKRTQ